MHTVQLLQNNIHGTYTLMPIITTSMTKLIKNTCNVVKQIVGNSGKTFPESSTCPFCGIFAMQKQGNHYQCTNGHTFKTEN